MDKISMEVDVHERVDQHFSNEHVPSVPDNEGHESKCETSAFIYPSLFTSKTLLELSNSSWSRSKKAKDNIQPYLRGCKWSPDGTCCLTVVNNDGIHITELPRELYSGSVAPNRMTDVLDSIIHVKEAGLVYDFCWYPGMNSSIPETCFWITTRQNGPIQMWDAFDGSLRCSYRGYNSVDEMEPALSIIFTTDAQRIVAGHRKCLRTFDLERPGREFAEHRIASSASCLATNGSLLAVGSWNTSISLYNINEMGTYKSIGKMHGHEKGVTHIKFAPDGLTLVSGARKDHRLLIWDIRHYRRPLNILTRAADTNQRVYFDISPCGKYLVSGGTDGVVKVWDADQVDWKSSIDVTDERSDNATYKFALHKDCCNSISIHPFRPILATGSGQFHFLYPKSNTEELISNKELSSYKNKCQNISDCRSHEELSDYSDFISNDNVDMKYSSISENCLVFWWIGDVELNKDIV